LNRVPADLDRADRFLLGLTIRQMAIAGPAIAALVFLAWFLATRIPPIETGVVMAVLLGAVVGVSQIHTDGMSPEVAARRLVSYLRAPRRLVVAPEGLPPVPKSLRRRGDKVGVFDPAWRGFAGGDIDLGNALARPLAVSSLDLQLRSDRETGAITAGFARLLNAADGTFCVVVRAEPVDISAHIARAEATDGNPALRSYALAHAAHLESMSGCLRRQPYVVVRGRDVAHLDARTASVLGLLRPFGIRATRLDDYAAVSLIARATGSPVPERRSALPGEKVRS
jgi:hypothetical protein